MPDHRFKVTNSAFQLVVAPGQRIEFQNARGGDIDIEFSPPEFFNGQFLKLVPGGSGEMPVQSTARGEGAFYITVAGGKADPIKGEVVIPPNK